MAKTRPFDQDRIEIDSRRVTGRSSRGTIQHGRRELHRGNSKRFYGLVGGTALVVGGGLAIADQIKDNYDNPYKVNVEAVTELPPEERDSKFVRIVVGPDQNLNQIASIYMDGLGIDDRDDHRDIVAALKEQDALNDHNKDSKSDGIIHPGDQFYCQ